MHHTGVGVRGFGVQAGLDELAFVVENKDASDALGGAELLEFFLQFTGHGFEYRTVLKTKTLEVWIYRKITHPTKNESCKQIQSQAAKQKCQNDARWLNISGKL